MKKTTAPVVSTLDKGGGADRTSTAPLLKWAGGKREVLSKIIPLLPAGYRQYFEPFLGGGALFLSIQPPHAVLGDTNEQLINCYVQVRDNAEALITHLSTLRNTETDYYAIRGKVPSDSIERASRLIYLTTLSFNGIHRLNLKGEFNVPYGGKTHMVPCKPETIRAVSKALAGAELRCSDFAETVSSAGAGDLIYLDPPYTVAHGTNGFLKYNAKIFSWQDQIRLASLARQLRARGCHVVVSNADYSLIRELYADFRCYTIKRFSRMAASKDYRRAVTECVFIAKGDGA